MLTFYLLWMIAFLIDHKNNYQRKQIEHEVKGGRKYRI